MRNVVLFDLDGTLLPMDQDRFVEQYVGLLAAYMAPFGYEPRKMMQTLWAGTEAMIRNDGSKTNETVFWERFREVYGARVDSDMGLFEEFYAAEFGKARVACGFQPGSAELIAGLKEKGYRCVLATNPLFPETATMQRIRWAGLNPRDFELVTTYENSSFCKPNPEYYREIMEKLGVTADQCLMVGNDGREDLAVKALGVPVFLLTDCLLHGEGAESHTPRGDFAALRAFAEQLPPVTEKCNIDGRKLQKEKTGI